MREEKKREVSEVGCAGTESKLVSAEVERLCIEALQWCDVSQA